MAAGTQTLSVTFNPTNTTDYNNATASVTITVDPAATTKFPVIYVSETNQSPRSGVIEAFSLDVSSGILSPVSGSPFGILALLPGMPTHFGPAQSYNEASSTMAIDMSGTFLFSNENGFTDAFSCCSPDTLVGFKIESKTGALTRLPSTPVTLVGAASKIVVR